MIDDIHPTKLAIMKAAVDLFVKKGFSGATTKEISQAAGIAEGTVFRHFTSKTEILYGVVEGFSPLIGVDTLKETILECKDLEIRDAVQYIIKSRFEIVGDSFALLRLVLIESNYDLKLREIYMKQVYQPIHQMLRDFFEEKIRKGHLKDVDPNLPTSIILSSIIFEIYVQELSGVKNINNSYSFDPKGLTDILMDGILKRRDSDE